MDKNDFLFPSSDNKLVLPAIIEKRTVCICPAKHPYRCDCQDPYPEDDEKWPALRSNHCVLHNFMHAKMMEHCPIHTRSEYTPSNGYFRTNQELAMAENWEDPLWWEIDSKIEKQEKELLEELRKERNAFIEKLQMSIDFPKSQQLDLF